ncbi:MAG: hypothetical protein WCI01_08005 [Chlorobiaceae bacterium]
MSEEIKLDPQTLLGHAQWLAQQTENAVEGILNRSGVLLGAIGVEMSILPVVGERGWLRIGSAVVLGFGAFFMVGAMWPRKRKFPATSDLREVYAQQRRADLTAIVHMIGFEKPDAALLPQLQSEAKNRSDWFRIGMILFVLAQGPLLVMIGRS